MESLPNNLCRLADITHPVPGKAGHLEEQIPRVSQQIHKTTFMDTYCTKLINLWKFPQVPLDTPSNQL
ncbi:hypothetical protein I79_011883 [Cricetulus griseus]|uniref:Uncharacterized protein n=1 Tax=Cricetulus griseus TaxID=10029 RepID=G3HMC8_CRIGR|nr:hypothetical protein I79_011883 [Cricetulus griseus]